MQSKMIISRIGNATLASKVSAIVLTITLLSGCGSQEEDEAHETKTVPNNPESLSEEKKAESVGRFRKVAPVEKEDDELEDDAKDDNNENAAKNEYNAKVMRMEATAYTAFCDTGCTGVTATGIDVSDTIYHEGKRIIAVDPDIIPLGSTVQVTLDNGHTFKATAQDTGGAIKGAIIDVLHETKAEAREFGRKTAKVKIISVGGR